MNPTFLGIIAVIVMTFVALRRASFLSANKARQLLKEGAMVVDVRTSNEFRSGHVHGAINIPLGNLATEAPRKIPDKRSFVLLHCLSGARSGQAQAQLKQLGYANVHNLGSYNRAASIMGSAAAK